MAPRLIRRRPLLERIKAYLDPVDFLLWLSEELESSDWVQWQKEWAVPIGILLNVLFLIARANGGYGQQLRNDGVFGDDVAYRSLSSWFVCTTMLSQAEGRLTGSRRRHSSFIFSLYYPSQTPRTLSIAGAIIGSSKAQ